MENETDSDDLIARKKVPFDRTKVIRDWNTILVNPWNELPSGFTVELTDTIDSYRLDSRITADFETMMEKAKALGYKPLLISAYRSMETQTDLFNAEWNNFKNQGMNEEDARATAAKSTARPGTRNIRLDLQWILSQTITAIWTILKARLVFQNGL